MSDLDLNPMTLECPECGKDGRWHLQNPDVMRRCIQAMQRKQWGSYCLVCGGGDSGILGDLHSFCKTAQAFGAPMGMYHDECFHSKYTKRCMHIVECHIIYPNAKAGRYQATAMVVMEDGTLEDALSWYSDELHFLPSDFIGKTLSEVGEMFHRRDVAYLQS